MLVELGGAGVFHAPLQIGKAGQLQEWLEDWDMDAPEIHHRHVSHLYETGASLYFMFLAAQREGEEIEQWRAAKHAASEAIVEGGGTVTHHHAVGRDHAPWMEQEIGGEGVRALLALKAELDPAGIMNPGKLILDQ